MKRSAILCLLAFLIALSILATVKAQIPSDPSLVYVHVTAKNSKGLFVTGLQKEQFRLFEDNVPHTIAFFSAEKVPINLAVLVDAGATKDQVEAMASTILLKSSTPVDDFFVAEVGADPLNDAIYKTINQLLQGGNNQRALVLFTARTDPGAFSYTKVRELLRARDVQLYVIAVPERPENASEQGRSVMRDLAEMSGGSSYFPTSMVQLGDIYRKIGVELRNQYLIGYRPTNTAADGKWRKIKVTGSDEKLTIHARQGYYAPTPAVPKK